MELFLFYQLSDSSKAEFAYGRGKKNSGWEWAEQVNNAFEIN